MRLINTTTLELEEYHTQIPEYAILSHTWGDQEVTFQGWHSDFSKTVSKRGFEKIHRSCKQARKDGHKYLWCDTNCIDKTSPAELSEAVNSMFAWYRDSAVCYAYLEDVPPNSDNADDNSRHFSASRWFTRGWTLQELLAPRALVFFARNWTTIGTRSSLSEEVSAITKIKKKVHGTKEAA